MKTILEFLIALFAFIPAIATIRAKRHLNKESINEGFIKISRIWEGKKVIHLKAKKNNGFWESSIVSENDIAPFVGFAWKNQIVPSPYLQALKEANRKGYFYGIIQGSTLQEIYDKLKKDNNKSLIFAIGWEGGYLHYISVHAEFSDKLVSKSLEAIQES